MTGLTKGASYKTHMIHRQHSAATLMSNYGSALISTICIMNSGLFWCMQRAKRLCRVSIYTCTKVLLDGDVRGHAHIWSTVVSVIVVII